ncbi:acyltransferase [Nocardiopsis dassonvillei]|nr:acyltransferase family protein [Nocardiopsis dassonvillei]APC36959.1 acyltransferase [Nocardiopsis dassonvillei]
MPQPWDPAAPTSSPAPTESTAPASSDGVAQRSTRPPARDSHLDNAKFLLITLVVVGHAIEPLLDQGAARALYYWIYFFHMPAFILVSGYLARSFDGSPARVEKLVLSVAVPYLVFWGIHKGIYTVEGGELPETLSPLEPTWTLWFLIALFVWRLSVPVWQRLKYPVLIAVLISLFAASVELGTTMSLGRVLSFLPFFVLGLCLRREHFALLARTRVRVVALVFLASTVVLAVPLAERLDKDWLYWVHSLTDRAIDPLLPSVLIRLGLMGLALLMTAAFLALVPRRRTWFTDAGRHTMYVFLWHSVVFILLKASPWYDSIDGEKGLVVTVLIGLALVPLLSSSWVRRSTHWVVEPKAGRLLREDVSRNGLSGSS